MPRQKSNPCKNKTKKATKKSPVKCDDTKDCKWVPKQGCVSKPPPQKKKSASKTCGINSKSGRCKIGETKNTHLCVKSSTGNRCLKKTLPKPAPKVVPKPKPVLKKKIKSHTPLSIKVKAPVKKKSVSKTCGINPKSGRCKMGETKDTHLCVKSSTGNRCSKKTLPKPAPKAPPKVAPKSKQYRPPQIPKPKQKAKSIPRSLPTPSTQYCNNKPKNYYKKTAAPRCETRKNINCVYKPETGCIKGAGEIGLKQEDLVGNYKWLLKLKTLIGPVAVHMMELTFKDGKTPVTLNVLMMGDLHTKVATGRLKAKEDITLQNFVLKLFKTNPKCFDLFIETYSPHIEKYSGLKTYLPDKQSVSQSHITKVPKYNRNKKQDKMDFLSVGTRAKSNIKDNRRIGDYSSALGSLRYQTQLESCRWHGIDKYVNKEVRLKKKCKFPNLRYHSWDLRFYKNEYNFSIFSQVLMNDNINVYNMFETVGVHNDVISTRQLLLFIIGQPLSVDIYNEIKNRFLDIFRLFELKIKAGQDVHEMIKNTFDADNKNADWQFKNFERQTKLKLKQFKKVPKSLQQKLVNSFIKVYNNVEDFYLALTDFYAICRMLSKFKVYTGRKTVCDSSDYSFCKNSVYYGGNHHTQLMILVFIDLFGKQSLKMSTGIWTEANKKKIDILKFKKWAHHYLGANMIKLQKPNNFLELLLPFYKKE
jgi:hypothetical protein